MESQSHIDLVKVALKYIRNLVYPDTYDFIEVDSAGNNSTSRVYGNFVPDIFYSYKDMLIIGEAKTADDFFRIHSKEQYAAYIDECNLHNGQALIVVSVPWQLVLTAKNYFKKVKKDKNITFDIVIINEMGRCFKI